MQTKQRIKCKKLVYGKERKKYSINLIETTETTIKGSFND